MKRLLIILPLVIVLSALLYLLLSWTGILRRNGTTLPKVNFNMNQTDKEDIPRVSVVAEGLDTPWALAFTPDNQILVTERSGAVKLIENGAATTIATINVLETGESGLQGIALDPDFSDNKYVYFYYTAAQSGQNTTNQVARFTLENNSLIDEKILVDNIPGAPNHDGGRIKFGPDGFLYITTGDAQVPSRAQDTSSLAGKILRVDRDGKSAPGNPFGNEVYSYGHRNPQGITWNDSQKLFATEHGRSGARSGFDEFNRIEIGKNYGWPEIQGDEAQSGMEKPLLNSGATTTWAPAGLAYLSGKFYFAGLRGNGLYEVRESNGEYSIKKYFDGGFGRLREVIVGPDQMLYLTTSNRDGRGTPDSTDDKILRINPEKLQDEN